MIKFIFTHNDKKVPEGYTVINNADSTLDHRIFSEIAGFQILFDTIMSQQKEKAEKKLPKVDLEDDTWISLNHYRRTLDSDYFNRTTIAQPVVLQCPLFAQYAQCHNIEDLKLCGEAVKATYPHMVQPFEQVMNGNIFIPYNMGIMTVGQFKDYFTFLKNILVKTLELMGVKDYDDMKKRVEGDKAYTGKANDDPNYQMRIPSFLAERISTVYWLFASKQMPVFPCKVNLLEKGQTI